MTLNIAHRGGAALWPENTLVAFADAIASGCDGAELDVQLSRDGAVVVHHDFCLMAGVARKDGVWLREPGPRIADLPLAELRAFDVGHPEPGSAYALQYPLLQPVNATVPTLEEVIRLAQGAPRPFELFVELKCEARADPITLADAVYDAVAGKGFLSGVIFVSFDWRTLARLRQRGATCWFSTDTLDGDPRPMIDAIVQADGQGWFPNFPDATADTIGYARSKGLKVGAWTVNAVADMERLLGLDAICTDRPDLLASLI